MSLFITNVKVTHIHKTSYKYTCEDQQGEFESSWTVQTPHFLQFHSLPYNPYLVTWTAKESQSNQSLKSTKQVTVIVRRATGFYRHVKLLIWTSLQELSITLTADQFARWLALNETPDINDLPEHLTVYLTLFLHFLTFYRHYWRGVWKKYILSGFMQIKRKNAKHITLTFFLSCSLRTGSDKKYQYI